MSATSDTRQQVSEYVRTLPGIAVTILLSIGVLLGVRAVLGLVIDNPIHPVTYRAVIGGGLGSLGMLAFARRVDPEIAFAPMEFWANVVGEGEAEQYQLEGYYLHVVYGSILAAFYPRLMQELTGGGAGSLFAEYPLSLVTGAGYAVALFVLGLVYAQVGLFRLEMEPRRLARFLGAHLVYGVVLGLVLGFPLL